MNRDCPYQDDDCAMGKCGYCKLVVKNGKLYIIPSSSKESKCQTQQKKKP